MSPKLEQLADAIAPLVAEKVAELLPELLAEQDVPKNFRNVPRRNTGGEATPEPIDAAEAARRLGVSRGTIYELADELGARRVGTGPRPRLKFDPAAVDAYGRGEQAKGEAVNGAHSLNKAAQNGTRRTSRRPDVSTAPLLPVKGRTP